jgi:hypothetical protein
MFVLLTTTAAAVLGAVLGYATAGIGGAIVYGLILGLGGRVMGALLGWTAALLGVSWRRTLALTGLLGLAAFTWGVYV